MKPLLQSSLLLEDLLGDLRHARRTGDIGRLALLIYCEVRRWARMAGEEALAEQASRFVTMQPHATRRDFLLVVDLVIHQLQHIHQCLLAPSPPPSDERPRLRPHDSPPAAGRGR